MNYVSPENVISPKDFIEVITILVDEGEDGISLAVVEWEGAEFLAIRWNVARREYADPLKNSNKKQCIGMPSSRGYPVWFLLPQSMFEKDSDLRKKIDGYLIKKT
jgi:hypothetical protein